MICAHPVLALRRSHRALLLARAGSVFSQRGPIKSACSFPSRPLSANGKEMANGLTLYLEEQKQQLAGREPS